MKILKIIVWLLAVVAVGFAVWRSPEYSLTVAQSFTLLLEQNL